MILSGNRHGNKVYFQSDENITKHTLIILIKQYITASPPIWPGWHIRMQPDVFSHNQATEDIELDSGAAF